MSYGQGGRIMYPIKHTKNWASLSDPERKHEKITGNSLDSSLEKLENVRKDTLEELAKREDDWLMKVDKDWPWGPTNNYCKWFMCVSMNQIITVSSSS